MMDDVVILPLGHFVYHLTLTFTKSSVDVEPPHKNREFLGSCHNRELP